MMAEEHVQHLAEDQCLSLLSLLLYGLKMKFGHLTTATPYLDEVLCTCDEVSEGVLLVEVLAVLQPAQHGARRAAVACMCHKGFRTGTC